MAEVRIKKVVCFPCSIFLSNVGRKTKIHVTQKDGTRGGNADGDNACRIAGYAVSTALTPFFFVLRCFVLRFFFVRIQRISDEFPDDFGFIGISYAVFI